MVCSNVILIQIAPKKNEAHIKASFSLSLKIDLWDSAIGQYFPKVETNQAFLDQPPFTQLKMHSNNLCGNCLQKERHSPQTDT